MTWILALLLLSLYLFRKPKNRMLNDKETIIIIILAVIILADLLRIAF